MDKRNSKANNTPDTMRRKQALVTITPYNEQEKRTLNETTTTTAATTTTTTAGPPVPPPAPPPLPFPSKNRSNDESVEMQSIESFKLKETPNTVPKPPPTYFPLTSPSSTSDSPRHVGTGSKIPKDAATSPVAELAKNMSASVSPINGPQASKLPGGKVAIRIGSYEGETKQPSRLEFLPQQPGRDKNGIADETDNGPVVSRLQNELAATLQRSNLRKKTEGENQSPVKTIHENVTTSNNETTNSEPNKLLQSNIEKLASALSNKVTIKVNPENSSR